MMIIKNSLQYKMLRLVSIQALFFVVVLAVLWLINPKWVFWHQEQNTNVAQSLQAFKHHYEVLSTLNIQLAQQRIPTEQTPAALELIHSVLHKHIQGVKEASLVASQHFQLDFEVLIHFLFNYRNQINELDPSLMTYQAQLWEAMIYYSRIQSEFFFIVEEIDRAHSAAAAKQLVNAQSSLLLWGLISLAIIMLGATIAIGYARVWKQQISQLLAQIYRVSVGDYNHPSDIHTDDEFGVLANALNEAVERVKAQQS